MVYTWQHLQNVHSFKLKTFILINHYHFLQGPFYYSAIRHLTTLVCVYVGVCVYVCVTKNQTEEHIITELHSPTPPTGPHQVAQTGLEFAIFLPQPPKYLGL